MAQVVLNESTRGGHTPDQQTRDLSLRRKTECAETESVISISLPFSQSMDEGAENGK